MIPNGGIFHYFPLPGLIDSEGSLSPAVQQTETDFRSSPVHLDPSSSSLALCKPAETAGWITGVVNPMVSLTSRNHGIRGGSRPKLMLLTIL